MRSKRSIRILSYKIACNLFFLIIIFLMHILSDININFKFHVLLLIYIFFGVSMKMSKAEMKGKDGKICIAYVRTCYVYKYLLDGFHEQLEN